MLFLADISTFLKIISSIMGNSFQHLSSSQKLFYTFFCSFADKTETNVIAVICKISKEFQIMFPTINSLAQTFIVGVYFKSGRVSMQCHAMNNGNFNYFIKSATTASVSGAVIIITNLTAPVIQNSRFL